MILFLRLLWDRIPFALCLLHCVRESFGFNASISLSQSFTLSFLCSLSLGYIMVPFVIRQSSKLLLNHERSKWVKHWSYSILLAGSRYVVTSFLGTIFGSLKVIIPMAFNTALLLWLRWVHPTRFLSILTVFCLLSSFGCLVSNSYFYPVNESMQEDSNTFL